MGWIINYKKANCSSGRRERGRERGREGGREGREGRREKEFSCFVSSLDLPNQGLTWIGRFCEGCVGNKFRETLS